jgi:hypothetical protein
VDHQSVDRKFYIDAVKYILLGVKKAKIGPQSPKTEFVAQIQYGRVIYIHRSGILHGVRKIYF